MKFDLNRLNNNKRKSTSPFASIIIGIILLIVGTILLWWNEGNNVKNMQMVKEATKSVIDVSSDRVDNENDGKLICTSGDMKVYDENIVDSTFSVGTKTAKLTRIVEMYQWEEEEHTSSESDTKSYTYTKKWSSEKINSSNFYESGHSNNVSMPYNSESFYASDVFIGEFKLSQNQIKALNTN